MMELDDNTPVFCTAEIPQDLLNTFFREAYAAPELAEEGIDDVGVLINNEDPTTITHPTKVPVPTQTSFPFAGKAPEEVWEFAQQHIKPPILNRAIVILDERTLQDGDTCLLVTKWENPPPGEEGELLRVRAEFRVALVVANVKNLGIGGDEHFRSGSNGIIASGE